MSSDISGHDNASQFFEHGIHVKGSTAIMRSPHDLYAAWRDVANLPRFIDHLRLVEPVTDRISRWTTKGIAGHNVSWEAEIIRDDPDRRIVWKTTAESQVQSAGTILFTPLHEGRGTRMDVILEYVPPGRQAGDALSKMTGDDAKTQVREAMHRFRQVMETGETAVTEGQPVGAGREEPASSRQTDVDLRDISESEKP